MEARLHVGWLVVVELVCVVWIHDLVCIIWVAIICIVWVAIICIGIHLIAIWLNGIGLALIRLMDVHRVGTSLNSILLGIHREERGRLGRWRWRGRRLHHLSRIDHHLNPFAYSKCTQILWLVAGNVLTPWFPLDSTTCGFWNRFSGYNSEMLFRRFAVTFPSSRGDADIKDVVVSSVFPFSFVEEESETSTCDWVCWWVITDLSWAIH